MTRSIVAALAATLTLSAAAEPATAEVLERSIRVGSLSTIWSMLRRLGLSHKKNSARG